MTTSVKSDQKGNPIWHTGDAVWGDGFILELSLRKAPAQLYDVTPALSHGSNCDTYFGSAGLDDSDKIVQIGFFVGYNEPKEFSSSVIKAINHFTVPRNPHEGSAR